MTLYDMVIAGGGPAGLTAALYGRRAGKTVLIVERDSVGGQMTYSPRIENFPGIKEASGSEIADQMAEQALSAGAETEFDEVKGIEKKNGVFYVRGERKTYEGRSVILATGCKHRMLGVEREDEFIGNGISFCAVCDGPFYAGGSVALAGGGNSALQEALFLSGICRKVTIVQNLPHLTGEARLVEQAEKCGNMEILLGYTVESLLIDGVPKGIRIRSESGEKRDIAADGIFVAVGLEPDNKRFSDLAALDKNGYFDSDESCFTATDGLFVAGDCRKKRVRQITTAVSDGAAAALAAREYLDGL